MADLASELNSLRIDRSGPSPRRGVRWLVAAGAIVLLAAGALLIARAARPRGVPVETVRATLASVSQAAAGTPILTATGYVVPRRKAVVSAKIQGRLSDLRVEEGSRVKRGDILARLENADLLAQAQRAAASVARAEADLNEARRQQRLNESLAREKVASEDQLEAAKSRVAIAEASLLQAQADRAYAAAEVQNTIIRAPFDGVVVKKMAEVGESVAPIPPGVNLSTSSGAIVALADLETLEVEADVAESNVAQLEDEQPAEVTVEAFPDRQYKAVLRQVIPTADRTKATVQVKVTILDKDRNLKPEMTARVTFVAVRPERPAASAAEVGPAVVVPQEAVVTRDGRSQVFEIRGGRARLRPVTTGGVRSGQIVITEGLSGTETLVARPPDSLRDGDTVRVRS